MYRAVASLTDQRREVVLMSVFEMISIAIAIHTLLIGFGMLIIALLAYIESRDKRPRRNTLC